MIAITGCWHLGVYGALRRKPFIVGLLPLLAVWAPIPAVAELSLSLAAGPNPARPAEPLSFAITVSNTETPRSNVSVSFVVPSGFNLFPLLLSSEPDAVTCPNVVGQAYNCDPTETVTWTVGDLAAGEGRTLRLAPVIAAAAGDIDFAVNLLENGVPAFEVPPNLTIDVAASRRLDLQLAEGHDPARPGAELTYTLGYGHPVENDFTNGAVLRFFVPPSTRFVSASPGCTETGGIVSCSLGRLWPGEGGERRVAVVVDEEIADGAVIEAEAEVTSTFPVASTRARAVTRIDDDSDLVVAIGAGRNAARPGEALDLELTASNRGPITLFAVDLALAVPNGVTVFPEALAQSLGTEGADCAAVLGQAYNCDPREVLIWTLGDLAPGQSRTVRVAPVVAAALSGSLVGFEAWARPAGGGEGPEFGEAVGALRVQDDPPFDIALTDDRDPAVPGQVLTYTLELGHRVTASIAEDVVVRLGLPKGVTFQAASNGGLLQNGVVSWTSITLQPGESRTRSVKVVAAAPLAPDGAGDLLEAWVEMIQDTGDDAVRPEAASARAVTRVQAASQLALEILLPDPPNEQGETFVVGYRVRNVGAQTLFDVGLEGLVPTGVSTFAETLISAPPLPSSSLPECAAALGQAYNCDPREQFQWTIPQLTAGQAITVTVPYTLVADSGALPDGLVLPFRGLATSALHEAPDVAVRAVPEVSALLAGFAALAALAGLGRGSRAPS